MVSSTSSINVYRCHNDNSNQENPIEKVLYCLGREFEGNIQSNSLKEIEECEKQMIANQGIGLDRIVDSGYTGIDPEEFDGQVVKEPINLNPLMISLYYKAWGSAAFISNKYPNLCTEAVSTSSGLKCPLKLTLSIFSNRLSALETSSSLMHNAKMLFGRVFLEHYKSKLHLEIKKVLYVLTVRTFETQYLCPIARACFVYPIYDKQFNHIISGILSVKIPNVLTSIIQEYIGSTEPLDLEEYEMLAKEKISIRHVLPEIDLTIPNNDPLVDANTLPGTLLGEAVKRNNELAISLLLDMGANPLADSNLRGFKGRSVLDYARNQRPNLVSLLETEVQVSGSINADENGS